MDEKRTTRLGTKLDSGDTFDYSSFEEFIKWQLDQEKKNVEALKKLRKQADEERLEAQERANIEAIKEFAKLEASLDAQNIKLTNEQRKKALIDFQKKQEQAEQEAALNYWKTFSRESRKEQAEKEKMLKREENVYKSVAEIMSKNIRYQDKVNETTKKLEEAKKAGNEADIKKYTTTLKHLEDNRKNAEKANKEREKQANKLEREMFSQEDLKNVFKDSFSDFAKEVNRGPGQTLGEDLMKGIKAMTHAINALADGVNNAIDTYAGYQTAINARLQGIGDFSASVKTLSDVSYSPLIKTEELYSNLSELVGEGIGANVEQRAFLQTVKDGIATTFDANNSSLKRIIRLQQQDSTAARLGLEAYLTSYLNELTRNTEYLQSTFDSVANSLLEASSLMGIKESTEFEYVVQKWLGTLTGVGLSETASNAIAQAIGQLGSGNIEGLASSNTQNLLVMAASRVGVDFSNLLTEGLDAQKANKLLYGLVDFLGEISKNSSNVVKAQYAKTFGVTVSDLVAASNIINNESATITNLYNNLLTYDDMYSELAYQMNELKGRMGIANILENLFSNFTFSQGMSIASNPATFATWKVTDLIQKATGGINIPYVSALGSGIDLNASVEQLMKLGIIGATTLGGIGDIISGLSSVGSGKASSMLSALGITSESGKTTIRGTGLGMASRRASGISESLSTFVGNVAGRDYYESALSTTNDSLQEELRQKTQEETIVDKIDAFLRDDISVTLKDSLDVIKSIKDEGISVSNYGLITGVN